MKRKYTRRGLAACAAALLLLGTACTADKPKTPTSANTAKVGPAGGSFPKLNGVNVSVPAGAIQSETELVVSTPKRVPDAEAPFGLGTSTRVDISFKDGSQPAAGKPIDVRIPLGGTFRPDGTDASTALLYHRLPDGKGFRLVPAEIAQDSLHAQLPHLSEWDILYVDNEALTRGFNPTPAQKSVPAPKDACRTEVSTKSAGKVKLGRDSKGWDANGPVKPCLSANGNDITLSVTNKVNYLLPVAATGGLKLESPAKDAEEEMVRLLTSKIFPDKRVKTFLGRGGELKATGAVTSLPATVELTGDPTTFLAESSWFALKFLTGIFLGKPGSEVAADIKLLIEAPQVLSCLQNSLKISQGNVPSMGDVAELLTSKCSQIIADQLKVVAANQNIWNAFWRRVGVIGEGIVGGWNAFWTSVDGIRMQFNGTVRIRVVRVVAACPSAAEFQAAAAAENKRRHGGTRSKATLDDCADGWAYGYTQTWLDDYNIWSDGMQTVMHYSGGNWVVDHLSGSDGLILGEDTVCGKMPAKLRNKYCRVG